jgi:hypothetical protein
VLGNGPGPGVDSEGRPVIDPTENVIAILAAAVQRQDDLRTAEARHQRELASLREGFAEKLRVAEKDRIDAIRAVDQGNVVRAAEVQSALAGTLATQVTTTADAFRTALTAALEPIQRDIADLRKTQYEQAGQKINVTETQAASGGSRQWIGLVIASIVGFTGLFLTAAAIIITLLLRK